VRDQHDPRLDELDRTLRSVRFEPRASLGAEILGRWRRGEGRAPSRAHLLRRILGFAAVAIVVSLGAGFIGWLLGFGPQRVIDRCCQDFDRGGEPDDGLLIVAGPRERIERLAIYEDRDGSRSFTAADAIRFDRRSRPLVEWHHLEQVQTAEYCCLDYDGGGAPDDALVIAAQPPDRIALAVIYERDHTGRGRAILR
jgi:hypothetical protein